MNYYDNKLAQLRGEVESYLRSHAQDSAACHLVSLYFDLDWDPVTGGVILPEWFAAPATESATAISLPYAHSAEEAAIEYFDSVLLRWEPIRYGARPPVPITVWRRAYWFDDNQHKIVSARCDQRTILCTRNGATETGAA